MSTTQKPIFDTVFFNNITDGDESFKNELIDVFISSAQDQLHEIRKAAEEQNSNQYGWHSALHSLKGSCSSIGAIKLSSFIIEHQNKNLDLTKEYKISIYNDIKSILEETESEITKEKSN
ncbi:Hpt domain-containing protein [Rickettsiales bacterium]|nr:Hpt domain-containing protein [Rickettsiales bacterium]MDB2550823.1 Hpt domain-containing protein [Rickettsiales bacterium]